MKEIIKTDLTIEQVFENFDSITFENLGAKPYCSSYVYLDDGEGRSAYVNFSIEAKNNQVIVSMLKGDIPNYWRWQADEIFEDAVQKVKSSIGVDEY